MHLLQAVGGEELREILAGEEGLEPSHAGIKIRCLNQLGDSPTLTLSFTECVGHSVPRNLCRESEEWMRIQACRNCAIPFDWQFGLRRHRFVFTTERCKNACA